MFRSYLKLEGVYVYEPRVIEGVSLRCVIHVHWVESNRSTALCKCMLFFGLQLHVKKLSSVNYINNSLNNMHTINVQLYMLVV